MNGGKEVTVYQVSTNMSFLSDLMVTIYGTRYVFRHLRIPMVVDEETSKASLPNWII